MDTLKQTTGNEQLQGTSTDDTTADEKRLYTEYHKHTTQNTHSRNTIIGIPCTKTFLKLCALQWFSDNTDDVTTKPVGWVILTTTTRSHLWKAIFKTKEMKASLPQPHVITYPHVGRLETFVRHLGAESKLLIVEHAELLLGLKEARRHVHQFGRRLLFTQDVDIHGLCDLLQCVSDVDEVDTINDLKGIKADISRPPLLFHSDLMSPATTWLWHFVTVLFLCVNMSRMGSWWTSVKKAWSSSSSSTPTRIRAHAHLEGGGGGGCNLTMHVRPHHPRSGTYDETTRTRKRMRNKVNTTRGHSGHIRQQQHVHVSACGHRSESRTRRVVIRGGTTRRNSAFSHRTYTSQRRRHPVASGGGLIQWVVKGTADAIVNITIETITGLLTKTCDVVKKINDSVHKNVLNDMRGKRRRLIRAVGYVAHGMSNMSRAAVRSAPGVRRNFRDLNHSVQTLFNTDSDTAHMALACTLFWAILWFASRLVEQSTKHFPELNDQSKEVIRAHAFFPKRTSTRTHTSTGNTNELIHDNAPSHQMHRVRMGCGIDVAQTFVKGMLAMSTTHRNDPGNRILALHTLSEDTVTADYITSCFDKHIARGRGHLYPLQRKTRYRNTRVLIVMPPQKFQERLLPDKMKELKNIDEWNASKTEQDASRSTSHNRNYWYVSIEGLATVLLKNTTTIKFKPAHEIHFIVPPTHAEYQFVANLFHHQTISDTNLIFQYAIRGLRLEYDASKSVQQGTLVFEHVRTYHHLMSTKPISPKTVLLQAKHALTDRTLQTKTPDELFVELRESRHRRWQDLVREFRPESGSTESESTDSNFPTELTKDSITQLNNHYNNCTKELAQRVNNQHVVTKELSLETRLGIAHETVIRLTEEIKHKQQNLKWHVAKGSDDQKAKQFDQLMNHLRGFAPLQHSQKTHTTKRSRSH